MGVERVETGRLVNRLGGSNEWGLGGGEPSKKIKKIPMVKAVRAGKKGANGRPEGSVGDAGSGIKSTSKPLSLQARTQGAEQELRHFTLGRGSTTTLRTTVAPGGAGSCLPG